MAKDPKKTTKPEPAKSERKSNLPERPTYKYSIEELANALNITPASARVKLRNNGIEKAAGGVYGWDTKADFEAVLASLKKGGSKPEPAKAAPKTSAKPTTGTVKKKAA